MKYLLDFFKGIIIGISNVIPGFSGGTMAVILNEYERIITSFSKINKKPLEVIKDLWAMVIGMALGILLTSFTIIIALEHFPFPTVMLFVGLVLGTIPLIIKNIKSFGTNDGTIKFKIKIVDIICFIICGGLIVLMPLLNTKEGTNELNFFNVSMVIVMGIISAGAMIVPGLSGVLILMIFGYYFLIIKDIKDVVTGLLTFNFEGIGLSIVILLLFAVGAVFGLIFIAKLIRYALKKYPKGVYIAILGFLLASPFSMLYSTNKSYPDPNFDKPLNYVVAFITFALGVLATVLMTMIDKKVKKSDESNNKEK